MKRAHSKSMGRWGACIVALLSFTACSKQSEVLDLAGEYVQPQTAIRLKLDGKSRTLVMTEGVEVISSGFYFVKWKRLYCRRGHGEIVIGRVVGQTIETEIGPFVKTSS